MSEIDFDSMTEAELRDWAKQQAQTEEQRRQAALQNSEQMRQQAMADAQRTAGSGGAPTAEGPAEYAQKRYRENIEARVPLDQARAEYISDMIAGPPPKDAA